MIQQNHKHFRGYRVAVAVIGEMIVGIENSDGNTNVHFCKWQGENL